MRKTALLLLAAPLLLAACGGASSSAPPLKISPLAYVRHAARVTAAAPSEHMTMTLKMNLGSMRISMSGAGDYANVSHRGMFAMKMGFLGKRTNLHEVMDGTTVYVGSSLFSKSLPDGKQWMALDIAKLSAPHGVDFSMLMSRSPTEALQQLEAAGTVTKVDTETIDGVATTHFRIENLDIAKLPGGSKLEALGHYKFGPIDVWIGSANHYVYRETLSFTMSGSFQTGSATLQSDFSKFGEAVHVTVPPASQTVHVSNIPGLGS